jgi:YD repeat-containing protein
MVTAAVFWGLTSAVAGATIPPGAWRIYHDRDGRLKAITDPEGETAVYRWDANGNLVEVFHRSSVVIVQMTPPPDARATW